VPIRPENRDRYPDGWDDISLLVRFGRAGSAGMEPLFPEAVTRA
jgi:hypothetical protein